MDFIGSKVKLNDWIFEQIHSVCPPTPDTIFLDACAGSGAVSRYAAASGYNVISNDLMAFSRVVVNGSIGLTDKQVEIALDKIDFLNILPGKEGFFYKNFCRKSKPRRLYFTPENAKIIDHVREEIELEKDSKIKDYLLYCSIEALSRVSNTAGTHGAFLKKMKERANERFTLRSEDRVDGTVKVYNKDILKLLKNNPYRNKYKESILYLDPPYNNRQYGPNYHLYETFIRNDNPKLTGKTGIRDGWQDECSSLFCNTKKCLDFLVKVVESTSAGHIFMSYSTDGLLTENDILSVYPKTTVERKEYRRYKADTSKDRKYSDKGLNELLFCIKK